MREQEASLHRSEVEKPADKCAVFGAISFNGRNVGPDAVIGLASLQHRGQDGSGIAAFHPFARRFSLHKETGLVNQVFRSTDELEAHNLDSGLVVGHNRYATAGKRGDRDSLQPFLLEAHLRSLVIAHNGNIPGDELRRIQAELPDGIPFQSDSDSERLGWRIMTMPGRSWEEKVHHALRGVKGGYSLVIGTDDNELIGVRDPWEIRPLMLGRTENGAVLASETHAFERLHVKDWEEVRGGEMVVISNGEVKRRTFDTADRTARCVVEPIYFAHPISRDNGLENWEIRRKMGTLLAQQHPVPDADMICGIPDSGLFLADGYAEEMGLRAQNAIVKDRYGAGIRTFIQGTQGARRQAVEAKFSVSGAMDGKRVVLLDDSVVRGTTTKILIERLREKGARQVHVRSGSPRFRFGCDLGVDIASRKELLAVRQGEREGDYVDRTDKEIADLIGADSIRFLNIEGLSQAIGRPRETLCTHCLTGEHPIFDRQHHEQI